MTNLANSLCDNLTACHLALWQMTGGPNDFYKVEKQFPDLRELFTAISSDEKLNFISENLRSKLKNPNWQLVEEDLVWAQSPSHFILTRDDPRYPQLLKEITTAPPILFVKGDVELLNQPQLAIVGSRNPSHLGRENATQFAAALATSGYIITSGLALGIDAASHKGALSVGGKTIAVLGTGIDVIYPRSHQGLSEQIIHQGALISEFPRQSAPLSAHFPRRNRIISGLSRGVLVVEAALKSGSLITARFATEQNREVFAVPGSIHNPLARGCHALIRNGAKLVESSQDILEEFAPLPYSITSNFESSNSFPMLDQHQLKLVKCLDYGIASMDELVTRCGLAQQKIAPILLDLELKGVIISVPGGYSRA